MFKYIILISSFPIKINLVQMMAKLLILINMQINVKDICDL